MDMDIIATETKYVTATNHSDFLVTDPSYKTAEGIECGMLAAANFKWGKDSLKGLHIAIQGLGGVGYRLAKRLYDAQAKLTVYDVRPELVQQCVLEFGAKSVSSLEELLSLECDIFSPCALGKILNDKSISLLKAPIVAGGANNQLEKQRHGASLMQKEILYAPDYIINVGGLICAAVQYKYISEKTGNQKIQGIYNVLMETFIKAQKQNLSTNKIAESLAKEKIKEQEQ